jgi:FG-GAP repeat protein
VALSADGDTALIGGPFDNGGAGGAWVFTRAGATWTQQGAKLTANDGSSYRYFGNSVAVSADGNTALIGGPFDNNYVGAAWVFTRASANWTQKGPKLTASDETGQGQFGYSVALSADGNTALIGSPFDNGIVGAAWVFVSLLVGSSQIQPNVDSNPAGTAEAFRYTAASTGSAGKLSVYLDTTSTATKVMIGLYTNTSTGNPGMLLTSGTITNPKPGAWNTVTVPATQLTAGTPYWLAVLTPFKAGTIKFRDLPDGTGDPTQTSAQKSLMSMPSSWKTGTRFADSPASFFAAP